MTVFIEIDGNDPHHVGIGSISRERNVKKEQNLLNHHP